MTKFKVGDKVRILANRNLRGVEIDLPPGLSLGSIVTLKGKYTQETNDVESWLIKEGWQWMRADDLEFVEEESPIPTPEYSCIRVVPPSKPKREIVEGKIILNEGATIEVMKDGADDDVKLIIQESPFFTAKALREAAALFTTLAEVLEENENA